jgi:hypothetical protein
MNKIVQILSVCFLLTNVALAQNSGEIYGRVTDEKKQGLDFATVTAMEGGVVKGGGKTDLNGNYKIKPLAPGKYDVKVTYTGYKSSTIQGIIVAADKRVQQDFQMAKKENNALKEEFVVTTYKNKLVDASDPGNKIISGEQFVNFSSTKIADLVTMQAGNYQKKSGSGEINIAGGRASNTGIMIDGMMIRAGRNYNLPQRAVNSIEVMGNGLSAKYGNATGGIVSITTKGITRQLSGSVQLQHSVEGYNQNLGSLEFSGPLYSKKKNGVKTPIVGYVFNAQFTYDKDGDPAYYKYTRLKPASMERLQANPIIANPNGTGSFVQASALVTNADFEKVKARENGQSLGFNYVGKIDFQPNDNINVTLGTYATFSKVNEYNFLNSLFSPEANTIRQDLNARGLFRFTQRLGKSGLLEKQDAKKSAISNAFYTFQVSYQKEYVDVENPNHGTNIFDYGYVGKFKTHRSSLYGLDTAQGGYRGIKYRGETDDSVTFTPGGKNPILENYVKAIYNDGRFPVRTINEIPQLLGLRNGDNVQSVYGMWSGTGRQNTTFSKTRTDMVTVNLDASLDILQGAKNKKRIDPITHNIQFGLMYDQRTVRSYALGATGLWNVMRVNTNRQFKALDLDNPQFWVGGNVYSRADLDNGLVQFSPFDTIRYNQLYVASDQSRFDRELRKALGYAEDNTTTIDIDNLDPSAFKLEMFSADDLLFRGNDVVGYVGYDPYGKKLTRQPSFNDFWTKKDARGDFARPIGAFQPIYQAGYILDKFSYKDLNFNIGMRIDRYDANQKVLKDPYSLYGVRKVGDIANVEKSLVTVEGTGTAPDPSSFDSDYVVYIDNNQSSKPKVVGYRKGDIWFDPFGKEIADPTILSGLYANGLPIEPWLITKIDSLSSIKGANFNPNNSFEDYKPQVAISPRIQFSFPISDKALFYGNYDVVNQTPTVNNGSSINLATPDDYYFLQERQTEINNANLQMERAIKYSLGYQQAISKKAAITIEAFYQERKNQIQLQQFLLAYPISYRSSGNRDFSSTKGMTVRMDFRRNGPIRLNVDYTLQFAEGTGSSNASQRSLLSSGQPNLRSVQALDFDSRHILNVQIDYRYTDKNRGPKVGSIYPFENAGLNLAFRTNSGTPYTRSSFAVPVVGGDFNSTPFVGTINGSRLPWVYDLGLRIDKSFSLLGTYGKLKKDLYSSMYFQILITS